MGERITRDGDGNVVSPSVNDGRSVETSDLEGGRYGFPLSRHCKGVYSLAKVLSNHLLLLLLLVVVALEIL